VSVHEHTVSVGGGAIETPKEDASEGELQAIEHKAKAMVTEVTATLAQAEEGRKSLAGQAEESRRGEAAAEEEHKKSSNPDNNAEVQVYGDLATEALGGTAVKLAKTAYEMLSDDPAKPGAGQTSFDEMLKPKKEGVYSNGGADMGSSSYAGKAGQSSINFGDSVKNAFSMGEKANVAGMSLQGQGDCLSSWSIQQGALPGVQKALELTAAQRMAHEPTVMMAQKVREMQGPMRSMGMEPGQGGMAMARNRMPGMSREHTLRNGPKGPSREMLSDVKDGESSWA